MGLDMTITKLTSSKLNEKGNWVYEYEKIADLRNSWEFLDNINGLVEFGLNNSSTMEFTGKQLYEELEHVENKTEYNYVKEILEKAQVLNDEEEFYNVSVWW